MYRHDHDGESDTKKSYVMAMMENLTQKKLRHDHDGESDTKKCIVMVMMENPTQ
jgi:hypothetical protein